VASTKRLKLRKKRTRSGNRITFGATDMGVVLLNKAAGCGYHARTRDGAARPNPPTQQISVTLAT
jgi:hypothetical protein